MSRAWMPFYISDFQLDTLELTTSEIGVYVVMIFLAWRRNGPLPGDHKTLKCMLKRCFKDFHGHTYNAIVPKLLERYFYRDDQGNWRQKRVEKELRAAGTVSSFEPSNLAQSGGQTTLKHNSKLNGVEAFQYLSGSLARARLKSHHKEDSFNGGKQEKGRETATPVFVCEDTPQWEAWSAYWLLKNGLRPNKTQRKGTLQHGWYFKTEWPPTENPDGAT